MIFAILLCISFMYPLHCADEATRAHDIKQQMKSIIATLACCAPDGYTLFAAGKTCSDGCLAVFRKKNDEQEEGSLESGYAYLVKHCLNGKVADVAVEEVTYKQNQPICRCTECTTVQLKLSVLNKYLCLTNDKKPSMAVLVDKPKALSIHEPAYPKPEHQVTLFSQEGEELFSWQLKQPISFPTNLKTRFSASWTRLEPMEEDTRLKHSY